MNKTKKILALALVAVLICAASVAGTIAYLIDQKTITNTFTVGNLFDNGGITLTEHEIALNPDATYGLTEKLTSSGNQYNNILPGTDLPKDPTVKLTNLATNAYVYLAVKDNLAETVSAGTLSWTMHDNWIPLRNESEQVTCTIYDESYDIYVYSTDGNTASIIKPVSSKEMQIISGETKGGNTNWQGIHVSSDYQMADGAKPALKFCAMICQSNAFSNAYTAWNTCFGTGE